MSINNFNNTNITLNITLNLPKTKIENDQLTSSNSNITQYDYLSKMISMISHYCY